MVDDGLVIMIGQRPDIYWVDISSQKKMSHVRVARLFFFKNLV